MEDAALRVTLSFSVDKLWPWVEWFCHRGVASRSGGLLL